jgi:hypothetical protein
VVGLQKTGDLMSGDGWKQVAEAMRRRQEEEAWKALDVKSKKWQASSDEVLQEQGRAAKSGTDPAFPTRTNYHRKRTRRS